MRLRIAMKINLKFKDRTLNQNFPISDEEPLNIRKRILPETNSDGTKNPIELNHLSQEIVTKDILSLPKTSSPRNRKDLNTAVTSKTSKQNSKRLKEGAITSNKDYSNWLFGSIVIMSFISMIWYIMT